jgi:hypothetical protein
MQEANGLYVHQDYWVWGSVRDVVLDMLFMMLYISDFAAPFIIIRWEL